jgi:addiction module HigA family antidote
MTEKRLRPVHPGDILRRDFMKPMNLSARRLAKELDVSIHTINEIVHRRRGVTAEMALRLARFFGTTPQLWQKLQCRYDLEIAVAKIGTRIEHAILPLNQIEMP